MKKIIISLLILALLLSGCGKDTAPETSAPTPAPEATEITDTTEMTEIPEDQEAVTRPPAETETITVTRQVRMASLNENGEEQWYREYTYDDRGRLSTEREVSSTGEETYRAAVTYTDTGREILYTYPEGRTATIRETWDAQGNIKLWEYIEDGETEYYTEYTYDQRGLLTGDTTHYVHESAVPRNEYTYDELGNRTGHYEYSGEELTGWLEMSYDEEDRCAETCYYGFDGELVSRTEHSWEGNTEIRSRMDPGGAVYMVILVTYDDSGNLLRQETQQEGFVISCTEYTYESIEISAP